ncbi:MAG: hypothetical protein VX627_02910 [Candidatus Thermoplasmatota archaeon]|nr:hypothetical protein [Candidatus Thermoplasmatota archaeon]
MSTGRSRYSSSMMMVFLMVSSTMLIGLDIPSNGPLESSVQFQYSGLDESVSMSIHSENGSSSGLKAEVPIGHTIESIDLTLEPDTLAFNDAVSWSGTSAWSNGGAILDRVDVNKTEGMQLLPQEWSWDFETSNHGWTLSSQGGWAWGYDSTLGSTNGVHSGTKALYTYNGNYPNYMSSTYWATSPAVDCSSCSGSWSLTYWKRLGVEYHYYDHAYVQITNAQGNWVQLYSNVGTVNDNSYRQSTHSIGNYVQNNPSLQVRFGLGTTDGSVTYTGWNLDDVAISPSQGAGGGEEANWTSARFGPDISGTHHTKGTHYGIASIDATVPSGADLKLSILDGVSKTPIPGYSNLDATWVDLGGIDAEKHTSLRVKLHFDIRNGGTSPIVHAVHINHRYGSTFNSNPTTAGWSLDAMNWNGASISGSGSIISPLFTSHRPIAQLGLNIGASGNWGAEVSVDGGSWQQVSTSGVHAFTDYGQSLQIRLSCNSGSCTFNDVRFDLIGGHLPTHPSIDIGEDGWTEWDSSHPHISSWGWQSRFTNGDLSTDMQWATAGLKQVGILLPKSGLDHLSIDLAPFSTTNPVDVSFSIGGQSVYSKGVGFGMGVETIVLGEDDLQSLNDNLSNAPTFWASPGGLEYAISTFDVDGTNGHLRVGGLSAIHSPMAELSFSVDSPFILAMNQALIDAQIQSQHRMVPIPISSSTPGGIIGTITDLVTSSNVALDSYSLSNFSVNSPVTPSWQWMELNAQYSWNQGSPQDLIINVESDHVRTFYRFPVDGSPVQILDQHMAVSNTAESPLIFQSPDGGITFTTGGQWLNLSLPFQTNASLEDSENFKISALLYMLDGSPSPPLIERSGMGLSAAVENDVVMLGWDVYNELGAAIPQSMSYLQSDSQIVIDAHLGFENLADHTKNPRSGDVRVHLLENGIEKMNTTTLNEGLARFSFATPLGTGDVTYTISVEPLFGQEFHSNLDLNRTFTVDSLNPQVVDQNIAQYDHRAASPNQFIRIEVYDRPVLPTELNLMVWREWIDDTNQNGLIDVDEYIAMPLTPPSNLSMARGNYTLTLDDTDADDGDIVAAYIDGADPAGNAIADGGNTNSDSQLFTYQVLIDGPPSLPAEGGFEGAEDGKMSYLHPGVDYSFSLHIIEPNGWSDIGTLRLQLASNSVSDTLAIEWSASDGRCNVLSPHMYVEQCGVHAWSGELTPFNPDLKFFVDFQLNWTLPREGDMRWEPSIEVTDRSGQGAWLSLPQLRWRYSPDLAIDTDTMLLSLESGTFSEEGAWVAPSSDIDISGAIHFPATGTRPSSSFDIRLLLDGDETILHTEDGLWSTTVNAPTESGSYPLTVELADLPSQANDVTDTTAALRWIVVDPAGPEPLEVISPRVDSELPLDALAALQIDVRISELEQINQDSLVLHWKVIRGSDVRVTPLALGESPMIIAGGNLAGQSIIAGATLNLDEAIPAEYHSDQLYLHIWITGMDMAGNEMQQPSGTNQDENPFASWSIERIGPIFVLTEDDVTYSDSGDVEVGENVMITIAIRNEGEGRGTASIRLIEAHLDDENTRELTAIPVDIIVDAGGRTLHHIDWQPEIEGRQWIRVTMEDGTIVNGPTINVVEADEGSFITTVFSGVNLVWTLMFIGLLILLASVLMIALRSGGSRDDALFETDDIWTAEDEESITPPASNVAALSTHLEKPQEYPLDYNDETVRHVISQHGITDAAGFLAHAKGFDADNNGYLREAELQRAAASFVVATTSVQQPQPQTTTYDPATMSPEQLAWYEQAKQWGGYYDEDGNWVPI